MNQLPQVFNFNQSEIRIIQLDGQPWFVAKDVCDVLELSNPTVSIQRLDSDEVTKFNLGGLHGEVNIVNEYGLYSLILGSRKQEAKEFKRWITHNVIPSIRKHGAYMTPQTIEETLNNPDFIIGLATRLKEEQSARKQAELKIELDRPKVIFAEALETSKDSILIGELAKIIKQNGINIGQNRMFEWLRQNGYLCTKGDSYNMPTQRSMDLGLFEIMTRAITNPDGTVRVTKTTRVTRKGCMYFINKLKGAVA